MTAALPTCILADDNAFIREVLTLRLQDSRLVDLVGEAVNCPSTVELICSLRPQVAYIDVRMPGGTGIEVVARVRELGLDTKIMVFSACHELSMVNAARAAGASGFMLKDAPGGVFMSALQRMLAGEAFVDAGSPHIIDALSRSAAGLG
ncbi:MAG: tcsR1 [Thermoleophilia bacterium]|nr:tcsR1 [Thermoleophilia bacterium]